jgi:hypothetical protein
MIQHIRPSQFIISYGPGAILETRFGPRIIPLPNIGLPSDIIQRFDRFEISDRRMTEGLLGGSARIFKIPSNAELNLPEDRPLYRTKRFPEWKLCLKVGDHPSGGYILFRGKNCPECTTPSIQHPERLDHHDPDPIRFIIACPKGHMDDVDWYAVVHGENGGCTNDRYFIWQGTGSLRSIYLKCPRCRRQRNLGEAYDNDYECTGRYPEREEINGTPNRPRNCRCAAKIIQRQASNLRIPELKILFTVPPRYTKLHALLQLPPIYVLIRALMGSIGSKEELAGYLHRLVESGLISKATESEIMSHEWEEIARSIDDVMGPVPKSYEELLRDEFHALIRGSIDGIPPIMCPRPGSPPLIEIDPHRVKRVVGYNGHTLRIVPVLHLHSIMVQTGYMRDVGGVEPEPVDIGIPDPVNQGKKWYPGIELFGEGIFILLDENDGWHFELEGSSTLRWREAFNSGGRDKPELHPVFVWWHTLSHLLIRSVSLDAGYSSASIRERVYLEFEGERVRGGIILYATQPGSDGALGGLIALVPYFERILGRALESSMTCSCDPLCWETKFSRERYNGAACYGCLLLSETSCEHRNMWLDRNVLNENMP